MRSQFEFLMSEDDESEFISAFVDQVDTLKKDSNVEWLFVMSDCHIQFLPSRRSGGQITLGRIAIATHGFGNVFAAAPKAERLFERMRSWLKKRYSNRLMAENITIPGSASPRRTMWLGLDARARFRRGEVTFRTAVESRVVITEEPIPVSHNERP